MACVALPLIKTGKSVGVLLFFVGRSWAADEEIIALMARMARERLGSLSAISIAHAEKAKAEDKRKA